MGMGPSQGGIAAGVPSKGGASARYARQYVQPSQQPDPYGGMQTQPAYMQTQPAQPVRQIGDMSFVEPAVMPPSGTFGAPSFADAQPAVMPLPPPGQRLAGQEYAAGLSGVTMAQALEARQPQPRRQIGDLLREQQAATSEQPNTSMIGMIPRSLFADLAGGPAVFPGATVTRDDGQGQPMRATQPLRQIGDMSFAQPAVMPDDFLAARQAGLQVGPTPNQPPNPYEGMGVGQLQQMNEMIRMQQMQADAAMRNQVPWYMRPPGMNEQPSPYSSFSQPYQRQMPYQMPYQQPMYQQPYQPAFQRPMSPFGYGGLAALFSRMRGF